jgi:hypothetical protein
MKNETNNEAIEKTPDFEKLIYLTSFMNLLSEMEYYTRISNESNATDLIG